MAERSLPLDAEHLRRLASDVSAMTDALCELRAGGRGVTPQVNILMRDNMLATDVNLQAENLAKNIQSRLGEVAVSVGQAVSRQEIKLKGGDKPLFLRLEKSGIQQPAPTVSGRLEQARRWLEQPGLDDRGVGPQALGLILEEAKKVAEGLPASLRGEILGLCSRVEGEQARLLEAVRRGEADNPQAVALARSLTNNIGAVADCIQGALVDRVVEDFIDIATPLKQFTDCVLSPGEPATREQVKLNNTQTSPPLNPLHQVFDSKSAALVNFSNRVVSTARLVATGNTSGNKKLAEALLAAAGQVGNLKKPHQLHSLHVVFAGGEPHPPAGERRPDPHGLPREQGGGRAFREPPTTIRRDCRPHQAAGRRGDRLCTVRSSEFGKKRSCS